MPALYCGLHVAGGARESVLFVTISSQDKVVKKGTKRKREGSKQGEKKQKLKWRDDVGKTGGWVKKKEQEGGKGKEKKKEGRKGNRKQSKETMNKSWTHCIWMSFEHN